MIYLDHNATTPLDARVRAAMEPYLGGPYANASSQHRFGRAARDAVETARGQVAALVGAQPGEVVFTSGGTEANNLALKGLASWRAGRLLYSAIEHPCVVEPMQALGGSGRVVEAIAVDGEGRVDPRRFERQLRSSAVGIASCMLANNETGVIQDVAALAAAAHGAGAAFHADAVQAAGKIPVDFAALGVQCLSLSSHKLYGPKGAGALIVESGTQIEPLLHGGGQERGLRGGTENVAALAGFGVAAELAAAELAARAAHGGRLRDRLERALDGIAGVRFFGRGAPRVANTSQFAIPPLHSATLLGLLDKKGFAVSSGSACASGSDEPSPVLLAMGVPPEIALCAIRVSVGKDNTDADVDGFVAALQAVLRETLPARTA
ncbi:MAG TPA: cysteine desulfurase family protein [Candidatus Binatia bacterium]|nr:cysteine desulfurase family protein [Candidatus Binatia bacterium]